MKWLEAACVAMLSPALALAGPNHNSNSNRQHQNETDVESSTVEWSSGQGRLGVMVMGLTPELRSYFGAPKDAGLLVAHVDNNSVAARAGIHVGDVITRVDEKDVGDALDIVNLVSQDAQRNTAANVPIEVVRNKTTVDLQANLGGRNAKAKTNQPI